MTEPTPEAYEAALDAAFPGLPGISLDEARRRTNAAVAAVWPIAEATVRAKVAAEIRAYAAGCLCTDPDTCPYADAARIAEGNGDAP